MAIAHSRCSPVEEDIDVHVASVPVATNAAYGYHLVITPQDQGSTTSVAGTYTITNLGSGLTLDTQGGGTSPGTLAD